MKTKYKYYKLFLILIILIMLPLLLVPIRAQNNNLVVGLEVDYAPFNYAVNKKSSNPYKLNVANETSLYASGYDIFIAKEIGAKLDKNIIIKKLDWDALITALNAKEIDLVIAGMSRTPEREKEVLFTNPYYSSDVVMVVNKNKFSKNNYELEELKDSIVGAQRGTMYVDIAKENFSNVNDTLDKYSNLLLSVNAGTIDFFLAEYPIAKLMINNNPNLKTIPIKNVSGMRSQNNVDVNIALRKDDIKLRNEINEVLNSIDNDKRAEIMDMQISYALSENKTTIKGILADYGLLFLSGIGTTLILSIFGTLFGFIIALGLLLLRENKVNKKRDKVIIKCLKHTGSYIARGYIGLIRGTPMIVQAMIIYFGLAPFFNRTIWTPLFAGLLIVSFNTAAYIAEILRGSINGLDVGQTEAARSLGLSNFKTKLYIIWPQAIQNSLPAIGNEFIVNLKDTAVLSVIGVVDLYNAGRAAYSSNFAVVKTFIIIALIYLVLTFYTSLLIKKLENRRKQVKNG